MKSGNGHIVCVPGQRICEVGNNNVGGEGTYTSNNYIYASQPGQVSVAPRGDINVVKVCCCISHRHSL